MKIFNKNEWKKVKLGDICDLKNGVAIKSEDYVTSSNTLNCRMSNIRPDGTFDILYNAKYLPDNFSEKYKNYLLKNGDLVIAMTDMAGDPKILGVPTVVKSNGFNIIQNQRVGKLELLTKNIDENYLKLVLQSKKAKNYFKKFSAGGVQLNLSKKEILNVPIILPTIEEQKKLSNLFKIIENFIYLRKEELVNLHFLNKSLFTKIFGDIEKKFEYHKLSNICDVRDGTHDSPEYITTDKRFPLITSKNLKGDKIDFSEVNFISEADFNKINVRSKVDIGDILMPMIGTIGNPIIVKINKKFSIKNLALIKFKNSQIINTFLKFLLLSDYFNLIISQKNKGGTQKFLSLSDIRNFLIPVPPIELQNKFAERIEKIEKLKFTIITIILKAYKTLKKKGVEKI